MKPIWKAFIITFITVIILCIIIASVTFTFTGTSSSDNDDVDSTPTNETENFYFQTYEHKSDIYDDGLFIAPVENVRPAENRSRKSKNDKLRRDNSNINTEEQTNQQNINSINRQQIDERTTFSNEQNEHQLKIIVRNSSQIDNEKREKVKEVTIYE